jgi:DNA-binding NarL/FixJ family response regulator
MKTPTAGRFAPDAFGSSGDEPAAEHPTSPTAFGSTTASMPEPGIRVLLVSNLLLIRAGLRQLLESRGFVAVAEASTCDEALDLARRERCEVIVIDMEWPTDTVACLVELAPLPVRTIALCDRRRDNDPSAWIECGATGVVLKTEAPEVLVKAITKVHAGEIWIDRANTAKLLTRIARKRHDEDIEIEKIARLTPREREIIELVGEGLKNPAIAERLFISEATVRNHLTSILDKVELSDRFELVVYAYRHALVRFPGIHALTAAKRV